MKKLILILAVFLTYSFSAFAADTYKELARVDEGETLGVIAEFNVGGVTYTRRVPIFGTYDDAYIAKSLNNYANTVKAMSVEDKAKLESVSDVSAEKTQREADALAREQAIAAHKALVDTASVKTTNIGKTVTVTAYRRLLNV